MELVTLLLLQPLTRIVMAIGIVISVLGAKQDKPQLLLVGVVMGITGFVVIQAILGTL